MQLTDTLLDVISDAPSKTLNMHGWLSRATLDVIGEGAQPLLRLSSDIHRSTFVAAFGYKFNALADKDCKMAHVAENFQ